MKISATVMVLLALIPCSQCMAQTPPAATAAAPMSVADFLATLSNGQSTAPDTAVLPSSPTFLSTVCHDDDDCPTGQLCCYPCGVDGCDFMCMTPYRGHCPWIP